MSKDKRLPVMKINKNYLWRGISVNMPPQRVHFLSKEILI
jgi:hypothetical protein